MREQIEAHNRGMIESYQPLADRLNELRTEIKGRLNAYTRTFIIPAISNKLPSGYDLQKNFEIKSSSHKDILATDDLATDFVLELRLNYNGEPIRDIAGSDGIGQIQHDLRPTLEQIEKASGLALILVVGEPIQMD